MDRTDMNHIRADEWLEITRVYSLTPCDKPAYKRDWAGSRAVLFLFSRNIFPRMITSEIEALVVPAFPECLRSTPLEPIDKAQYSRGGSKPIVSHDRARYDWLCDPGHWPN